MNSLPGLREETVETHEQRKENEKSSKEMLASTVEKLTEALNGIQEKPSTDSEESEATVKSTL